VLVLAGGSLLLAACVLSILAAAVRLGPSSAAPLEVHLRVLLIGNTRSDPAVASWEQVLSAEGVPYTVAPVDMGAGRGTWRVNLPSLSEGRTGNFNGVIVADGPAAFAPGTFARDGLQAFEASFAVRQIDGQAPVGPSALERSSAVSAGGLRLTTAGRSVFPALGRVLDVPAGTVVRTAPPPNGATTPWLESRSGRVLAAVVDRKVGQGREVTEGEVLFAEPGAGVDPRLLPALLNWVTGNIHLGSVEAAPASASAPSRATTASARSVAGIGASGAWKAALHEGTIEAVESLGRVTIVNTGDVPEAVPLTTPPGATEGGAPMHGASVDGPQGWLVVPARGESDVGTGSAIVTVTDPSGTATTGPVLYTVAVAGGDSAPIPTGSVDLTDQVGGACSFSLDDSGDGSCSIVENATDSPFTVTASYGGDDNYAATSADNSAQPEVVVAGTPTVKITGPSGATTGQVSYSVSVSGPAGADVPSGGLTVSDDSAGTCTITSLDASGDGSCSIVENATDSPFTVTASYGGDANYNGATATTTETVGHGEATVTVTGAAGATTGPVSYSVTASGAGDVPTGKVTVSDDSAGTCTITTLNASGKGNCSIVENATDSPFTVTASYAGDGNYTTATGTTTETVGLGIPTVTLTSPAGQATGPVTLTTTVAGKGVVPTGTVAVADAFGGTCTIVLSAGAGSCTDFLEGAVHNPDTITATYQGDKNYATAIGTANGSVAEAVPSLSVSAPPPLLVFAGTIDFNVTATGTGPTPAGILTISDSPNLPGSCTTLAASPADAAVGQAICTISVTSPSVVDVTTTLATDGNYTAATAETKVSVNATAISLTMTSPVVTFGQEAVEQFSATLVSPAGKPTAPISIRVGSTELCSIPTLVEDLPNSPNSYSGQCAPASTKLAGGTFSVVAVYPETSMLLGSASTPQVLRVKAAATSTSLSLTTQTLTYGNEQVETVNVSVVVPPALPNAGGVVTAKAGSVTLCAMHLKGGSGSCTLTRAGLAGGTRAIAATFGGSADYASSTSGVVVVKVLPGVSMTTMSLSRGVVSFGQQSNESITAVVSGPPGGVPATGTVTVMSGKKLLCTIRLSRGTGSCALGLKLAPGTYSIIARYGGSSDLRPSVSPKKTLVVTR
jgi:hypothetical protein